jgi:two-component system CheB/CheR fusion protein
MGNRANIVRGSSVGMRRPAKATRRKAPKTPAPASDRAQEHSPCIVAIGASAGGFDALIEFLHVLPANSGLAFIILQHLSPSPRSLSAELFSRHTQMSVKSAEEGMQLQANCVYTAPADKDIRLQAGHIRLSSPTEVRGRRLPVDQLFASLGQDQRERAIGIILSGTGSDGALGLKEIVANGGIVLAQDPKTAQYDGMPRSAMVTGLVTHVLPVSQMPRVLLNYARHRYVRAPIHTSTAGRVADPIALILDLLRTAHGQSFTSYKQGMLVRRIERRMGLANIKELTVYAKLLRSDAIELATLRKDLLIGVTQFFRDAEAWKALDTTVLRPLIAGKKSGEPIRAWVAGAGTGEEAYTLAILILARLRAAKKRCTVQVFATDANQDSLNYARAGRYPLGIESQVSAQHLSRYFQEIHGEHHFEVTPQVRESVIFGAHDLLADPPFSRLDVVSCRNLLIYIEPAAQARILLLWHFALKPAGHLFLGSAETVGVHDVLFKSVSRKWHIFQKMGATPRDQIDWQIGAAKPLLAASRAEPSGKLKHAQSVIAFRASNGVNMEDKPQSENSQLRQELRATQETLQNAIRQLKTSNEELRASHEETMSINEELQSMNEELESSKEELQSVNEELNTVNTQLQSKVSELEVANTDLRNLLASNEVATLCLDRALRIKWFTPATNRLFNLLPSDIGRPIADLSLTATDSTLIENARSVLQTEGSQSSELQYKGVHLRRIVPYRAQGTQIEGVVISFTDITEAKRAALLEIEAKSTINEQLEERVRERTQELARLSRDLALAEVRERQTIARDLHDGLGQELNAASIKLDALRSDVSRVSGPALDDIAQLLEGVVREMRSLTAQLNPPVLEQLGLIAAIEWLSEEMRRTYRLDVLLKDDHAPKPLDSVTASILFRAVRELLINVARHTKVKIAHITTRVAGDQLVVRVTDQGDGFATDSSSSKAKAGLGLATLRERITHIGGTFRIESDAKRGTAATIQVPMTAT